jgi:hypothetical protein
MAGKSSLKGERFISTANGTSAATAVVISTIPGRWTELRNARCAGVLSLRMFNNQNNIN